MSDSRIGLLAILGTYTIWGLSALYYAQLSHVPPLEVLAHRTVWSFLAFFVVILVQGRLRDLLGVLHPRTGWSGIYRIIPAAIFVSINWFLFVYAIQIDKTLEASLAYYISPLLAAAVGWVVFKERLSGLQWPAMGLALTAVVILTVGLGAAPWMALAMSSTFVAYSVFKKGVEAGPTLAMAAETTLLMPVSLVYLIGAHLGVWGGDAVRGGAFGANWHDTAFLAFSGIATGVPLLLFGVAAKRVTLSSLNIGHYYNATLQLTVAVLIFGQAITLPHMVALPLVWLAVSLFSLQALRRDRQVRMARKASVNASIDDIVL
ncbi:EamA family transporter RarD [Celeribacter marinus]|uniref:EamA family transporter RarD n=1 Tax=Celeribacter marinus TaxID=1397108 RepID=UPI003F6D0DCC